MKPLRAAFDRPLLSAALLIAWLGANGPSVNQLVLGGALTLLIVAVLPSPARRADGDRTRPSRARRGWLLTRFGGRVAVDIVSANIAVARLIVAPTLALRPAFVRLPLRLRDPAAIALLANVISLTPGTVSSDVEYDAGAPVLLVHALDVDDPEALVETLRDRYERPLLAIFGC